MKPIQNNQKSKQLMVFISSRSYDYRYARNLNKFLISTGIETYFAEDARRAYFAKEIDEQLDKATHMIVIATDKKYLDHRWVAHEWMTFTNEIKAYRKDQDSVLTMTRKINPEDLPVGLRLFQNLPLYKYHFKDAIEYIRLTNVNQADSFSPKIISQRQRYFEEFFENSVYIFVASTILFFIIFCIYLN